MSGDEASEASKKDVHKTTIKNATDLQRLKIEKLMSNPEKLAYIPDQSKDKKFPDAPEFVRNVMGSSAGAGSGEFHVYRHIRRREYSRQEFMVKNKEKERLDEEFLEKLETNKREAEEKTAKKRAKRQKQKERMKNKKRKGDNVKQEEDSDSEEEVTVKSEDEER